MKKIIDLLFSFKGTISRKDYILFYLGLILITLVLIIILIYALDIDTKDVILKENLEKFLLLNIIIYAILLYPRAIIDYKRIKDTNLSIYIFYILFGISIFIFLYFLLSYFDIIKYNGTIKEILRGTSFIINLPLFFAYSRNNIENDDKIIKQTSFLNLKGNVYFQFKENGLEYKMDDKQEKTENFYDYSELYNYKNAKQVKSSHLYYLLVGIIFGLIALIYNIAFYFLFFITFMFLYYKSYENFLRIDYGFYIKNDSKAKEILSELEKRVIKYRREKEFIIDENNDEDFEKNKFEKLLEDEIITKEEYDDIIKQLEKLHENINSQENQNNSGNHIISELLSQKGITNNFEIENYTFEHEYLPGGIESFSGIIALDNGDKYNFWLNWDKDFLNKITKEKGYYNLGDSEYLKEKYGKYFFYKIINS